MPGKLLTLACSAALTAAIVAPLSFPAAASARGLPRAPTTAPSRSQLSPPALRSARTAGVLKLLVEPRAGIGPVYRLITGARRSVDLTMYELRDATAEADLAADAARGVDVRVVLDRHLERSANTAAYDYLTARHVHVRWGPAGTTVHQKTLTVDSATSVIMTLNLVTGDYPDTRDFAVIDTSRADVAAIVTTFNADFAGHAIRPPDGADLVWSPANAQSSVLSVIRRARHSLAVEDEEMDDAAVTSALAAAARRGVSVRVVMTADSRWDAAFTELARAGVHIRLYADEHGVLYIHAKVIVADAGRAGQRVLIGSENFSVASLDYNRELGILTRNAGLVAAVSATVARDYARGSPFTAKKTKKPARAWCRATASVYNAADNENNVYVHSNQRHTTATASADGYRHSYPTNGSGYALIYLNGPPPGVTITVRVGGATCTTSD